MQAPLLNVRTAPGCGGYSCISINAQNIKAFVASIESLSSPVNQVEVYGEACSCKAAVGRPITCVQVLNSYFSTPSILALTVAAVGSRPRQHDHAEQRERQAQAAGHKPAEHLRSASSGKVW